MNEQRLKDLRKYLRPLREARRHSRLDEPHEPDEDGPATS